MHTYIVVVHASSLMANGVLVDGNDVAILQNVNEFGPNGA